MESKNQNTYEEREVSGWRHRRRAGAGTGAAQHLPGKARLADEVGAAPGMLGQDLAPGPELLEKLCLPGSLEAQLDNTGATADCNAPRSSRAEAVPWPRVA